MDDRFVKITNAAYRALEFFPESEPLKNRAKEKVLTIMENLALFFNKSEWAKLNDCFKSNRERRAENLLEDIEIILNFLKLGRLQGWLSDANFLIISNEYEKIGKEVLENMPARSGIIALKENFGESRKLFNTELLRTGNGEEETQKQVVRNNLPALGINEAEHDLPFLQSKQAEEKTDFQEKPVSERQKKILKFLAENKRAQVMDLQAVLADVTKRTIRRDLDDLMGKRRIVRVGKWNQVFYQIF